MLKKETLESAIISAAKLQGHELNGQDKLVIRKRRLSTVWQILIFLRG